VVKCSRCGSEVKNPEKTWTVILGKTKRTKITFGEFNCEKCHKKFKVSIKKEEIPPEPKKLKPSPPVYLTMIV